MRKSFIEKFFKFSISLVAAFFDVDKVTTQKCLDLPAGTNSHYRQPIRSSGLITHLLLQMIFMYGEDKNKILTARLLSHHGPQAHKLADP